MKPNKDFIFTTLGVLQMDDINRLYAQFLRQNPDLMPNYLILGKEEWVQVNKIYWSTSYKHGRGPLDNEDTCTKFHRLLKLKIFYHQDIILKIIVKKNKSWLEIK